MSELIILGKDENETTFAIGDVSTVKTAEIPEAIETLKKVEFKEPELTREAVDKAFYENCTSIEEKYEADLGGAEEDRAERRLSAKTLFLNKVGAAKEAFKKAAEDLQADFDKKVMDAFSECFDSIEDAENQYETAKRKALEEKESALGEVNESYDAAVKSLELMDAEKANHEKELRVYEELDKAPIEKAEEEKPAEVIKEETPVVTTERRAIKF